MIISQKDNMSGACGMNGQIKKLYKILGGLLPGKTDLILKRSRHRLEGNIKHFYER
jgi:hypothetical protein